MTNSSSDTTRKKGGALCSVHSLSLLLASLDPLLKQVFVVAVSTRAQREHAQVRELTAVGVDEHWHQTVLLAIQFVHQPHNFVHHLLARRR